MVRTYNYDNYQLISPWEQAMRNADNEAEKPLQTGKRVYNNHGATSTNGMYNFHPKSPRLPPISNNASEQLDYLKMEVGKVIARTKERLKKIGNEFVLYDPNEVGSINKSAVLEILRRYKVPTRESDQRALVNCFTIKEESSKVNRQELYEYLERCKEDYDEKRLTSNKNSTSKPSDNRQYYDSTHGRYDSIPSIANDENKRSSFGRGAPAKEVFAEKRDAGLLLEIERAFDYANITTPHAFIDKLEERLKQTCRNEENLTDNLHVKSVVDKLHFPLNSALTMKCIDRLDPLDTGKIEWPKFVSFLRKAFPTSSNRYSGSDSQNNSSRSQDRLTASSTSYHRPDYQQIPDRPAWETRTPLGRISKQSNRADYVSQYSSQPQNYTNGYSSDNHEIDDMHQNQSKYGKHREEYLHQRHEEETGDYNYFHNDDYDQLYFEDTFGNSTGRKNKKHIEMDDDIEAAFVKYASELKNKGSENATDFSTNKGDDESQSTSPDFSIMGSRGLSYKRIADALKDQSKRSEGIINADEVKKIVNYYNLLFDTNIEMEQVNQVVDRCRDKNNTVKVDDIVGALGKEIV